MQRSLALLMVVVLSAGAAAAQPRWDCEASMRVPPDHVEYLLSRGICHLNNGDAHLAIADFDRFIARNPGWVGGYFNRGNAYARKKAYDLALRDYDEALRLKARDAYGILINRGNAYRDIGNYDRALADYDEAIRQKSDMAPFYALRALVYERKGETEKAIADYRRALEIEPSLAAAARAVARLQPQLHDLVAIDEPRLGAHRLDWCRDWSRNCGKPAADAFCRRRGLGEAASFVKAPRLGQPTQVLGSGELCTQGTCDGFARIVCRRSA